MFINNKLLKIIFAAALIIIAQTTYSCDMTAFVQSEFADRCQRLINLVDKAYISVAVEHPDSDKRLSEMSKDWIDFYLSHGKKEVQPPNMSFISPDIWERNLKDLGIEFKNFLQKKIDSKSYQKILLTLNLFKNEEKLAQLHSSLKAAKLCERQLNKIDNLDLWLNTRLLIPYSLIYDYENSFSDIVLESNIDVEEHLESIRTLKEKLKDKDSSAETQQIIFNMINEDIDKTLDKWEKRYYFR